MICLFLFLAFHWLTFYHMTPFRIKPSLVATPISERVSFSEKRPRLKRCNSLLKSTLIDLSNHLPSSEVIMLIYSSL